MGEGVKMEKPKLIKSIWDNSKTEDATLDCMTFVLDYVEGPRGEPGCLGTSYNGVAYSIFSYCEEGEHLGDKVEWSELGDDIKKHVIARLEND